MKKTYKKSSKPRQHVTQKRKYAIILIVCILGAMVIFGLYRWYEHERMLAQEAETYASLRQDMKNLHQEFNKIDPGWVYHEGCQRSTQMFTESDPELCMVSMDFAGLISDIQRYVDMIKSSKKFTDYKEYDEQDTYGYSLRYYSVGKIFCNFSYSKPSNVVSANLSCSGDPHRHYFEEIN